MGSERALARRHCERSEAIQRCRLLRRLDCFASLAMTEETCSGRPRGAAADLVDDDAVVEIGLAVADAGLQHFLVQGGERKLLAELLALLEHELHVFQVLAHAP